MKHEMNDLMFKQAKLPLYTTHSKHFNSYFKEKLNINKYARAQKSLNIFQKDNFKNEVFFNKEYIFLFEINVS